MSWVKKVTSILAGATNSPNSTVPHPPNTGGVGPAPPIVHPPAPAPAPPLHAAVVELPAMPAHSRRSGEVSGTLL